MEIDQVQESVKRTADDVAEQDGSAKKMKLDVPSEGDATPVAEAEASGTKETSEQDPVTQPEAGPSTKPSDPKQTKSKKQKKFEKRADRRERRRATLRPDGEERTESSEPKGPRLPKRQCALLLGYSGAGYNGMQMYVTHEILVVPRGGTFDLDTQAIRCSCEDDRRHSVQSTCEGRCGVTGQLRRSREGVLDLF